jgi:hypothetical protein
MRTMTEQEMREIAEAAVGATVFVSYVAGREPTERAAAEAAPHTTDPARPRRYLYGRLTSVWQNRYGEWCLTLFAENRNTLWNDILFEGGYRTINPSLGQLVVLDVIAPAA